MRASADEFARIWEAAEPWPDGPGILLDVVESLSDRSLIMARDYDHPNVLHAQLPMPRVCAELGGWEYTVMLPERLRPVFVARCDLVLAAREAAVRAQLTPLLTRGTQDVTAMMLECNQALLELEKQLMQQGATPLKELAREAFGLVGRIEKPAGLLWKGPALAPLLSQATVH